MTYTCPSILKIIPSWRLRSRVWEFLIRGRLGSCGKRVNLPISGSYTLESLHLGNDIEIGSRPTFWAPRSRIVIGDKVIMGPEVVIMGGDHNTGVFGRFLPDIALSENRASDDADVVLEKDIWIGARAIILKGVRIGRGAVVGAGAVVTRSVPPYSIAAGNPARPRRMRGTLDEIMAHEAALYAPADQLTRAQIEAATAACATASK